MMQKTTTTLMAASHSPVPQNKDCAVTTWNSSPHDERNFNERPFHPLAFASNLYFPNYFGIICCWWDFLLILRQTYFVVVRQIASELRT